MPSTRTPRAIAFALMALLYLSVFCPRSHAQAALLMEEPYGFFGALNPTGHTAVYFERICAETRSAAPLSRGRDRRSHRPLPGHVRL